MTRPKRKRLNDFKEYKDSEEAGPIDIEETDTLSGLVKRLENLQPKDKISESFHYYDKRVALTDTTPLQRVIDRLEKLGVDIGKGDTKYGYIMPVPKKGNISRDLIIYRR